MSLCASSSFCATLCRPGNKSQREVGMLLLLLTKHLTWKARQWAQWDQAVLAKSFWSALRLASVISCSNFHESERNLLLNIPNLSMTSNWTKGLSVSVYLCISHLIASFYTMLAMQWQRRRKINLVQNGNQIWISFFKNVMWFLSMSPCLTKPGGFLIPQKQKTVAIILYIICKQHVNKFPPGFTMKKNQGLLS